MVRYCYIVVEGPQDVEFLIGLLKFYELNILITPSEQPQNNRLFF